MNLAGYPQTETEFEMSYSTNPVLDQIRHSEALDKQTAQLVGLAKHYSQVINDTFTKDVRSVPASKLQVPYVSGDGRLVYQPLADAATDLLVFGKPRDLLMAVLEQSNCPHVEALRKAMADDYIGMWAAEIAEVAV